VDLVVERCAGLDVAKQEVVACVRSPGTSGRRRQEIRTFATFSGELERLADWLAAQGVAQVVVEATGQYCKPVRYVLEGRGFGLLLAGRPPRQGRARPENRRRRRRLAGRAARAPPATGSFVPPPAIRELRDLTRYRKKLIQAHTAERQRVHKALEDAGIKLDSVAADVLGVSGRAMLEALVAGTTDPEVLAELARGQLRKKLPALREALQGRIARHHRLLVAELLAHLDYLDEAIARLSGEVARVVGPFSPLLALLCTIPGWTGAPLRSSWPRSAPT
jgi:hypothetical protein